MSIIKPEIDLLMDRANQNEFLLCAMAAKRSRDITDMIDGQKDRALALSTTEEIVEVAGQNPLTIALNEIADGTVGYDTINLKTELVDRGIRETE